MKFRVQLVERFGACGWQLPVQTRSLQDCKAAELCTTTVQQLPQGSQKFGKVQR
jgi:hypothetical protein